MVSIRKVKGGGVNRVLILALTSWMLLAFAGEKSHFAYAPDGWKSETIPFPLGFAPEIDLQGVEELRFAPGMYKPDQQDYFSYGFVWVLKGEIHVDVKFLTQNLLAYYQGLYTAVSKSETQRTEPFFVQMEVAGKGFSKNAQQSFSGSLDWREPFVTEKAQTLILLVDTWFCPEAGKTLVMVLASPQVFDHPLWTALKSLDAVSCDGL